MLKRKKKRKICMEPQQKTRYALRSTTRRWRGENYQRNLTRRDDRHSNLLVFVWHATRWIEFLSRVLLDLACESVRDRNELSKFQFESFLAKAQNVSFQVFCSRFEENQEDLRRQDNDDMKIQRLCNMYEVRLMIIDILYMVQYQI